MCSEEHSPSLHRDTIFKKRELNLGDQYQAFGVGAETAVGVDRSRPLWPESESELESVKFCRLRLRPGVVGCHFSTDDNFAERVCIVSKTLKGGKKRRGGGVKINLNVFW